MVNLIPQGSNWKDDSIAHYVTAMTVVKSDGTIQEYNILNNAVVMGALRSCLGACGVITDVTLAVRYSQFQTYVLPALQFGVYLTDIKI